MTPTGASGPTCGVVMRRGSSLSRMRLTCPPAPPRRGASWTRRIVPGQRTRTDFFFRDSLGCALGQLGRVLRTRIRVVITQIQNPDRKILRPPSLLSTVLSTFPLCSPSFQCPLPLPPLPERMCQPAHERAWRSCGVRGVAVQAGGRAGGRAGRWQCRGAAECRCRVMRARVRASRARRDPATRALARARAHEVRACTNLSGEAPWPRGAPWAPCGSARASWRGGARAGEPLADANEP